MSKFLSASPADPLKWRAGYLLGFLTFVLGLGFFVPSAHAAPCDASNIRWAASSNIVYVSGAGAVCTLTEIDALATKANLTLVNPASKTWLLGTNIWLQNGARLDLHGGSSGDVNELRLKSDGVTIFVRAYYGTIDIADTKVTSWSESGNGPVTSSSSARSYIQAKSFLDPDGTTPRESTLNINNSDIGYLGYNAAESYGLSWKVLAATGTSDIYNKVGVKGSVTNSRIHHNYYGAYTWGADNMVWNNNEFDNNTQYGLDPHDNSDNLVIENNRAHHNGNHGIICSRYCDHLTIRNNKAYNNTGNGIMLHRLTDQSLVEGNEAYNNTDSGIAIFDSHNNIIKNNNLHHNKNGIRFSVGSSNNTIQDNTIANNSNYGFYFYKGSDAPTESGDGRPKNNKFINNIISNSGQYGIKLSDADNNLFQDNQFLTNGKSLLIQASTGNRFEHNTISGNKEVGLDLKGAKNATVNNNTIQNNGQTGVWVNSGSTGAKVTNNTIKNHSKYGILVASSTNPTISGNIFSGNGKNVGP